MNLGKECLAQCNDKSGLCEGFCGTKNYCCKKGETDNGCDGKDGGEDSHVCVLEPLGIIDMPIISFKSLSQSLQCFFYRGQLSGSKR